MKHRTWITEALRLHFEEHLPQVVVGRRLGVPKSTACGMFVRFRKAGFSWPLPAGMSERELDVTPGCGRASPGCTKINSL